MLTYEFYPTHSLQFSGHDWWIKTASHKMGPGNNWFSHSQNAIRVD
mgnify:CR=1 FL=1|jgi:hypothetical protein